jgi:hypothetical protein
MMLTHLLGTLAFALSAGPQDDASFESKIRPVFADVCIRCHGPQKASGKLRLDSREFMLKGGENGPAIVPGKPAQSLLLRALRREKGVEPMPPDNALKGDVIEHFEKWIQAGAVWPVQAKSIEVAHHWSFEPIRDVKPPTSTGNPIDGFLSQRQREKGLKPVAPADRRTLIRRVTFGLTGLPPTQVEVQAFANDTSADAYAKVIDRLLASPRYGECWGRHWLDVVRYADTAGETADFPVPDAWRYRNYVIDAFNKDKPFDVFVTEQLAGDILASRLPKDASNAARAELIAATGYVAIARRFGFDIVSDQHLTIEDTLDTLGKSFLGLTIACARCHDHKYDPITQSDYYALYGIFDSTRFPFPGCEKDKSPKNLVSLPGGGNAYAVAESKPHHVKVHKRGDPKTPGEIVPRRFLQFLGGQTVPDNAGSGRIELAQWLTGPKNPLTARVIANRIWQWHFGAGLVKTPNDFGTRGALPSHPELLDFLAAQLIQEGWSIKKLQRLILLSDAYQRGSIGDEANLKVDAENTCLWRFERRRLSAEEIRDSLLAVSGDLDLVPGTEHPFPPQKAWGYTQHNPFIAVYDHNKRSVYLMTQRIKRHPFLALFDGPDANASTGSRYSTTVPTQALYFLNDPFVHARSESLAAKLLQLPSDESRADRAYMLIFGRHPEKNEQAALIRFLTEYRTELNGLPVDKREKAALAAWVRVLFAGNEFIYVD